MNKKNESGKHIYIYISYIITLVVMKISNENYI